MAFRRKPKKSDVTEKQQKLQVEIIPPKKRGPKDTRHLYKPGQSGNPAGRPKGSRVRFAEAFVDDFLEDWELHGADAIAECRKEDVSTYIRVAASIIPKELNIKDGERRLEKFLEQFSSEELHSLITGIGAIGVQANSKASSTKA